MTARRQDPARSKSLLIVVLPSVVLCRRTHNVAFGEGSGGSEVEEVKASQAAVAYLDSFPRDWEYESFEIEIEDDENQQ